jgi:hypothetical protein
MKHSSYHTPTPKPISECTQVEQKTSLVSYPQGYQFFGEQRLLDILQKNFIWNCIARIFTLSTYVCPELNLMFPRHCHWTTLHGYNMFLRPVLKPYVCPPGWTLIPVGNVPTFIPRGEQSWLFRKTEGKTVYP